MSFTFDGLPARSGGWSDDELKLAVARYLFSERVVQADAVTRSVKLSPELASSFHFAAELIGVSEQHLFVLAVERLLCDMQELLNRA